MPVLWLKFSEEASLPFPLTEAERRKLDEIYDAADEGSVWNRAVALLGLPPGGGKMLLWHDGVPYVNWSLITSVISCGSMEVVAQADGGYGYAARATLMRLPALVRSQWRAAQYVEMKLGAPLPETQEEKLLESTALGLALQAIMLRLPKHEPRDLAQWLAAPDGAPPKLQQTIRQMQGIQKRRTQLSPAWFELFPKREGEEPQGPAWFWDTPPSPLPLGEEGARRRREGEGTPSSGSPIVTEYPHLPTPAARAPSSPKGEERNEWQGLPVCAGRVTGRAFMVRRLKDFTPPDFSDFPVLVFPKAKPETTEVFSHASALLFAEGGALSHACTIAREQGIPCITGLGLDFLAQLEDACAQTTVFLTIDGEAGLVQLVKK